MKRKMSLKLETIKGNKVPVSGFNISTVPSSRLDLGGIIYCGSQIGKSILCCGFC